MKWNIHMTQQTKQDIRGAVNDIGFELKNPEAAYRLLSAVDEKVLSLEEYPERFAIVNDPILSSWGVRYVVVNNYLAFYVLDHAAQTVYVVRFLYGKSNWRSTLKKGFSLQ